jgi:hypothetical protein
MNRNNNILLSIIVISYKTTQITKNCIESILKSSISVPYEIIIIDNASTDDTVEKLKALHLEYSNVRIIENKENVGFAKANNQGAKLAQAPHILLLNSDTLVLDNAIDKLYSFFKKHEQTMQFLGGKLFNNDKTAQASCGPFYSLPIIFGALFLKGDYWGLTRYSPNKTIEVDWISGACILTKKEYFEKIGGFDEKIFMYMDEIDLLYRAKQAGFRVWFYPEARFFHLGSASSSGKTYPILQVYRGFLYFYRKHHGPLSIFLLTCMLQLKALISLVIGKLTNNQYLTQTYEKAYQLTQET